MRLSKTRAILLSRPVEWARAACCLVFLLCCVVDDAAAQSQIVSKEDSVRAAFLYRLAFFVTWPNASFANSEAPINLCIAESASKKMVELLLNATTQPVANQRQLAVRVVSDHDSKSGGKIGGSAGCHMIFGASFADIDADVIKGPTLLIVNSIAELNQGGHLALVREQRSAGDARLVFYAKRERILAGSFKLSSKLMQLVRFL